MEFLESFGAAALAGLVIVGAGWWITHHYTRKADEARARRDRGQAAAAEFYRGYGRFFAVWKAWNEHLRWSGRMDDEENELQGGMDEDDPVSQPVTGTTTKRIDPSERLELLMRVADAEGVLESFLVSLTSERKLSKADLDRLWCFRRAYKQLRYCVRKDMALNWKRTDSSSKGEKHLGYVAYRAYKGLAVRTAELLTLDVGAGSYSPAEMSALQRLEHVTGPSGPLRAAYPCAVPAFADDLERRGVELDLKQWEWVAIARHLQTTLEAEVADRPTRTTRWWRPGGSTSPKAPRHSGVT